MATAVQVQEASISSSPPITPPAVKKLVRKPTAYDNMVHRFLGGDQKVKIVSTALLGTNYSVIHIIAA